MRVPIALLALLGSAALAAAGEVTKLPSPAKAEWVAVPADPLLTTLSVAGDKPARWVLVDDAGAELRPAADGRTATFAANSDGHFRVLVIAGEDVHRVKVVKASTPPQPMPPGPGPKPPEPTPPPPADPLVKLLQAGFDADARQLDAKRQDLGDLIELYRQAGTLAADPAVTSAAALVGRVRDAAAVLKITGLAEVRKVIGQELASVFPEDVVLDAATRRKAVEVFARIKLALEQVK